MTSPLMTFCYLSHKKYMYSMLSWICTVIDHRRPQSVLRKLVLTSFRCHVFYITEQKYGNMESISI